MPDTLPMRVTKQDILTTVEWVDNLIFTINNSLSIESKQWLW